MTRNVNIPKTNMVVTFLGFLSPSYTSYLILNKVGIQNCEKTKKNFKAPTKAKGSGKGQHRIFLKITFKSNCSS